MHTHKHLNHTHTHTNTHTHTHRYKKLTRYTHRWQQCLVVNRLAIPLNLKLFKYAGRHQSRRPHGSYGSCVYLKCLLPLNPHSNAWYHSTHTQMPTTTQTTLKCLIPLNPLKCLIPLNPYSNACYHSTHTQMPATTQPTLKCLLPLKSRSNACYHSNHTQMPDSTYPHSNACYHSTYTQMPATTQLTLKCLIPLNPHSNAWYHSTHTRMPDTTQPTLKWPLPLNPHVTLNRPPLLGFTIRHAFQTPPWHRGSFTVDSCHPTPHWIIFSMRPWSLYCRLAPFQMSPWHKHKHWSLFLFSTGWHRSRCLHGANTNTDPSSFSPQAGIVPDASMAQVRAVLTEYAILPLGCVWCGCVVVCVRVWVNCVRLCVCVCACTCLCILCAFVRVCVWVSVYTVLCLCLYLCVCVSVYIVCMVCICLRMFVRVLSV